MKHYGDITKISGYDVEPVWIVTGGSPCQDLSVAGRRAGLDGERSGLFMEQIRIIKEMRENDRTVGRTDKSIRPRYMVWENVYGAFSSNDGEDFRVVLEETARVVDKDAIIPRPYAQCDSWTPSGAIMGDGWSIAWRVHDAQFWGVPQRRKRISLVADFGGQSAPEILFERKGLSRDTEQSKEERQGAAETLGRSVDETSQPIKDAWGGDGKTVNTLTGDHQNRVTDYTAICIGIGQLHDALQPDVEKCKTLNCLVDPMKVVVGIDCYNQAKTNDTLNAYDNGEARTPTLVVFEGGSMSRVGGHIYTDGKTGTLRSNAGDNQQAVVIENHPNDSRVKISEDGKFQALTSRMGTVGGNVPMVMKSPITASHASYFMNANTDDKANTKEKAKTCTVGTCPSHRNGVVIDNVQKSIVRRLTPLECERLQGFPDGWTDIGDWVDSKGKKHKGEADSPRYKALGNSIALPFWQWMAERMVQYIDDEPTMASLFDGIGGFPLVYSRAGCKPIWASEIEEFPIAVTKLRFDNK